MKKNIAYALLSIPLFAVAMLLWILSAVPQHVLDYTANVNAIEIAEKLRFGQVNQMPGYGMAQGRYAGTKDAQSGLDEEAIAWDRMDFIGYRLMNDNLMSDCVRELHAMKVDYFEHITHLPDNGIIPMKEVSKIISDAGDIAQKNNACRYLGTISQDWRKRAWKQITGATLHKDEDQSSAPSPAASKAPVVEEAKVVAPSVAPVVPSQTEIPPDGRLKTLLDNEVYPVRKTCLTNLAIFYMQAGKKITNHTYDIIVEPVSKLFPKPTGITKARYLGTFS